MALACTNDKMFERLRPAMDRMALLAPDAWSEGSVWERERSQWGGGGLIGKYPATRLWSVA